MKVPPPSFTCLFFSRLRSSIREKRVTFSMARTWREITLGIMRSAIFPRIHERWKSSRGKNGEGGAPSREWRMHTMRPRRRSNPSTCHLRPVCSGSLSRSLARPLVLPPSYSIHQSTLRPAASRGLNFCANPFIRMADGDSFHPARHFIRETRRRQRRGIWLVKTS